MKVKISKIRKVIDKLQEIVDEAEYREASHAKTMCNTYGMVDFVSFGSDGYIDLDTDVEDLFEDENDE